MSEAAEPPAQDQSRKPIRVGKFLLLAGVAAVAIGFFGVRGRSQDEEKLSQWTDQRAVLTVALASPSTGGATRELTLPGDVEAFYDASLHAQVSGYVHIWNVDIGAKVKKGEVLAVIDTPELDQQITASQGELLKAKADFAFAQVTANRWSSLVNSAAVSQQAADEKVADARAKSAEVEAAQANLDRVKASKAFSQIAAPFEGVVTARNIDIGTLVNANVGSAALFSVADVHQMRVYVRVPESYAAAIKNGQKATLLLPEFPDRTFDAMVATTSHAIDQKSRSLLVELLADNPGDALSPGAFARVRFQIQGDPRAVRLPASAIVFRGASTEIATLGPDDHVQFKPVKIARDFGEQVEITGEVPKGDRVVANPPDSLANGEAVHVVGETAKIANDSAHARVAETERDHAE